MMAEQRNEVRQPLLFLPLYLSFSLFLSVSVCVCGSVTHTSSLTPSNLFLPISLSLCSLFHHSFNFSVFICSLLYLYPYLLYFSARIREDGSFNIEYDDGDKEFKVPATRMRTLLKRKSNGQILVIVSYI